VGRGFSLRSDVEFLRSFFLQVGANLDFIRKSIDADDPFFKPFLPKGSKYAPVKIVADNWYKDDFFCNELFNGCNPFTIRVIKEKYLRPEFTKITDENDVPIDLNRFGSNLFINQYPELRAHCWPNYKYALLRNLFVMEPEILTAITEEGKHIVLGIGFFFGNDGTDFEVFTPKGLKWNGHATPPNLWILAKMHALCADSQTHEMVKHLGMGHMFGETIAIAHHNTYYAKASRQEKADGNLAMGAMLAPHFTNLIAINNFARVTLVSPLNATISFFQGIRGEDFVEVIAKWYTQRT